MIIGILSQSENLYSTQRLRQTIEQRGHEAFIINAQRFLRKGMHGHWSNRLRRKQMKQYRSHSYHKEQAVHLYKQRTA